MRFPTPIMLLLAGFLAATPLLHVTDAASQEASSAAQA